MPWICSRTVKRVARRYNDHSWPTGMLTKNVPDPSEVGTAVAQRNSLATGAATRGLCPR